MEIKSTKFHQKIKKIKTKKSVKKVYTHGIQRQICRRCFAMYLYGRICVCSGTGNMFDRHTEDMEDINFFGIFRLVGMP